ncbi:MAG: hypothetical protein KJZ84_18790 [Bryobacteraceae bacterium]|nr:hypothetical protein [Bryobacteraceae bacterium]
MKTGTLRLAFYCTVLFVSGMAVGALSHRYYVQDSVAAKSSGRRTPEEYRRAYKAEMQNRLKLTPEQAAQLEGILDDAGVKFKALRDEQRPMMDAIQIEQTARIHALLTPDQQAEYARMREEREVKRKADEIRRQAAEQAEKERRSREAPSTR